MMDKSTKLKMESNQGDSSARSGAGRNPTACKVDGHESNNLGTLITDLVASWKKFDGAGSCFLFNLCNSLTGSQYEGMSRDLVAVLGPVFGCGESELVLCHLRKMESLLCGVQARQTGNQDKHTESQEMMLCRCLLLFVKLQAEYHHLCSTTLTSVINHILTSCDNQASADLVQELHSLDSTMSHTQSPTRALGAKKGQISSGSPRTQKHGFKASLFSLFEKKNSPEEGNSSFYVDIGQEGGADERGGDMGGVKGGHVTDTSQSQMLVQLGLDPGLSHENFAPRFDGAGIQQMKEALPLSMGSDSSNRPQAHKNIMQVGDHSAKGLQINGEVATQEELDNVINLLSGVGVAPPMQTIPEDNNPQRLRVPQGMASSLSPASPESRSEERLGQRDKGQRRSEGSIDLSGFGSVPGSNTWPYQHRSSLPGGQLGTYSQVQYDFNTTFPPNYTMDMRPTTLPPGGAGHFQGGYNWGFPDPKLNRTWPVTNLTGTGSVTDTINSSWSGAQDSDDLSDDSSCGDQFTALTQLQNIDQRNDISRDDSLAGMKKDDHVGDIKHHSLEDLLDGRSNTWPQQLQPWSQSQHGLEQQDQFHRPLQMQLSDPLTRRNLWPKSDEPSSHQLPQSQQNVQGVHHL